MSLCVNGAWYADACRCYKFWTGRTCDRRLCARGAGVLTPHDGLCRCRPGFGGEFCQYEICRHEDRWFCNTTEMAPPTIWDTAEEREIRAPELCTDEILLDWFRVPEVITPTWYCNCVPGYREVLDNNGTVPAMSPICTCPPSHFGRFCEQDVCSSTNRTVWDAENQTCVVPVSADEFAEGYFGFEINLELSVAMAIMFLLIAGFVLIGKWYLKKVDKEMMRAPNESDKHAHKMAKKIKRTHNTISRLYSSQSQHNQLSYHPVSTVSPRGSILWTRRQTSSQQSRRRKEGNVTPPDTWSPLVSGRSKGGDSDHFDFDHFSHFYARAPTMPPVTAIEIAPADRDDQNRENYENNRLSFLQEQIVKRNRSISSTNMNKEAIEENASGGAKAV